MNWINVNELDKLPETFDYVLFSNGECVYFGYRIFVDEDFNEWYANEGFGVKNVTHWMPLPLPPKETVNGINND